MLRIAITDGRLEHRISQIGTDAALTQLLDRVLPLTSPQESFPPVDFLLLRERDLPGATLVKAARQLVHAIVGRSTRILLAADPLLAVEAGAHGVHLAAGGDLAQARRQMPSGFITISCHTLEELRLARQAGVSAILFAPVFGKVVDGVEVVAGTGLERLREACQAAAPVPVIALGGITRDNTPAVLAAGAGGIAGIRLFFPPAQS